MAMCDAPKGNKATKQYRNKEATNLAINASQQKSSLLLINVTSEMALTDMRMRKRALWQESNKTKQ